MIIGNKLSNSCYVNSVLGWQNTGTFRLSTEASVDLAQDQELLDLMVAANFTAVFWASRHRTRTASPDSKIPKHTQLINGISPEN